MTQEQKAKAYDEAYKKVAIRFGSNVADEIFPELKESEDERIKKFLIKTIEQVPNDSLLWETVNKSSVLAWLAKQGEQRYLIGVDLGDPAGDKGCIFNYSNATIPQKDFTPIESK